VLMVAAVLIKTGEVLAVVAAAAVEVVVTTN
jgi:hypothetical protein